MNCLTHFEIYGDEPSGLANFYGKVFGWEVEQMPGISYWRINTGSAEAKHLNGIYGSGVMPAKEVELLSIAFDASFTHMYAPGTRRHIHNALKAGATVQEIMEILKICVAQGAQAMNLGVPILAEELDRPKVQPA